MDILNLVISDMSKEDVRFYKLLTNRMFYSHDRKDLQLFNAIYQSGAGFDEGKVIQQLYEHGDKNSFYRLRHRLLQQVNKSLLLQHAASDEAINNLSLISLYKFHFARGNYKAARYFLKKAEARALVHESLELLDIIYAEFIRLSIELMDIDPGTYIAKRKENFSRLQRLREIDQILAAVTYQLKVTQNLAPESKAFTKLLERTVSEHGSGKFLRSSKLLQLKLAEAISRILIQKHDFRNLELFLAKKMKTFRKNNLFTKSNHEIHLKLLTYLVNASFKNKKFETSLEYTRQLEQAMKNYDRMLFDKYFVFYTNALVINYSVIEPKQAIHMLEELKKSPMRQKLSFYEIFIYLNLALLYFERKDYDKSIRQIIELNLLDHYRKADDSLKLKIAITEMMIRYELKEFDVMEYRIRQIRRLFRSLLSARDHGAEQMLLDLLHLMLRNESGRKERKLSAGLTRFIQRYSHSTAEENALIKYIPWARQKLKEAEAATNRKNQI